MVKIIPPGMIPGFPQEEESPLATRVGCELMCELCATAAAADDVVYCCELLQAAVCYWLLCPSSMGFSLMHAGVLF